MTGMTRAQVLGLDEVAFSRLLGQQCSSGREFKGLDSIRRGQQGQGEAKGRRIELSVGGKRILEVTLREKSTGAVSQILCLRDMTHEVVVERLKTEFLATAAHELRTPLTMIFGYSEILLHHQLDEATRRNVASEVHQKAQAMAFMLNDMLDLVRLEEHGVRGMGWKPVPLQPLLSSLVDAFDLPTGRDPPSIALPVEPLVLWGDEAKVKQSLWNVLSNAYKYSPAGGPVEIELLESKSIGNEVCMAGIRVTDRGIGMTPEQQARVYERFYRADASGKQLGTGLGMSLVKEIVDLHRGRVDLRSELGAGTTTTLWFPKHHES